MMPAVDERRQACRQQLLALNKQLKQGTVTLDQFQGQQASLVENMNRDIHLLDHSQVDVFQPLIANIPNTYGRLCRAFYEDRLAYSDFFEGKEGYLAGYASNLERLGLVEAGSFPSDYANEILIRSFLIEREYLSPLVHRKDAPFEDRGQAFRQRFSSVVLNMWTLHYHYLDLYHDRDVSTVSSGEVRVDLSRVADKSFLMEEHAHRINWELIRDPYDAIYEDFFRDYVAREAERWVL